MGLIRAIPVMKTVTSVISLSTGLKWALGAEGMVTRVRPLIDVRYQRPEVLTRRVLLLCVPGIWSPQLRSETGRSQAVFWSTSIRGHTRPTAAAHAPRGPVDARTARGTD